MKKIKPWHVGWSGPGFLKPSVRTEDRGSVPAVGAALCTAGAALCTVGGLAASLASTH